MRPRRYVDGYPISTIMGWDQGPSFDREPSSTCHDLQRDINWSISQQVLTWTLISSRRRALGRYRNKCVWDTCCKIDWTLGETNLRDHAKTLSFLQEAG